MDSLRIYVDLAMPPDALDLLRAGTSRHTLVFPAKPVTSVLSKGEPDPQFATVDVAFGQPDLESIRGAQRLLWVQVSSAGITRYDSTEFRELTRARGIAVSNSSEVYNEACAVHALSFMLAQARQLPLGLRTRAARGRWAGARGPPAARPGGWRCAPTPARCATRRCCSSATARSPGGWRNCWKLST